MRATEILRSLVCGCLRFVHARRFACLTAVVLAALRTSRMSISSLGRALVGRASPKHSIKRVDRFIANSKLRRDARFFFSELAKRAVSTERRPLVVMDWTDLGDGFHGLVAAVPVRGRALPLYLEVYREEHQNSGRIEARFLKTLKALLPQNTRPIILTDAGFRGPFFRSVRAVGWDFVGRLRGVVSMRLSWGTILKREDAYARAVAEPLDLGDTVLYPKAHHPITKPTPARVVVGARPTKKMRGRPGLTSAAKKKAAAATREPWLIATSLSSAPAEEVIRYYAKRMHIEETFRDTKNPRWGCSLRLVRCHSSLRWEALLLIVTLVIWIVTLVGLAAEEKGLHRRYQANTVPRRCLSVFLLGALVLRRNHQIGQFTRNAIKHAIQQTLAT